MSRRLVFLLALLAPPLAAQPADTLGALGSLEEGTYPRAVWTRSAEPGLQVLPLRSVREAAALLPRVRGDFHSARLVVGARSGVFNPHADWYPYAERAGQEPVFVVDGVRVAEGFEVPFESVASVEALVGFVPARYGEAAGGLVLIETRKGGERFGGEVEVGTSERLDAYGHTNAAFSVAGALGAAERGRFRVTGSWYRLSDATPYGIETYRLSDAAFGDLQQNPQVLQLTDGNGNRQFLPLPSDLVPEGGIGLDDLAAQFGDEIPAGYRIDETASILSATETYTADRFELGRGKDDPLRDLRLYGAASFQVSPSVHVDAGGGVQRERADNTAAPAERWASELYAHDRLYRVERDAYTVWGRFRQSLTPTTAYELGADYQRWDLVSFPGEFSADVADALFYGDIDGTSGNVARRYFVQRGGRIERLFTIDGGVRPERVGGTYFLPGRSVDRYRRQRGSALRSSGYAETRIGIHRVVFGGEFEQQTRRAFEFAGQALARFYADGSVEGAVQGMPEDGVSRYEDLPFDAVNQLTFVRYGYDFLGQDEVDRQDIEGYYGRTDTDVAPHQPIYYAGYIQDRLTWRNLSLDLGLRVEAYDANTEVLKDIYATVPIQRAGSLGGLPPGVESDWAVYFNNDQVVGFRDLEGQFYNRTGLPAGFGEINAQGGRVNETTEPVTAAYESSPVHTVLQPRVGVRLAATQRVQVFAHYTRQARRPAPELRASFNDYEGLTVQRFVGNARLRPEILDAFGIGGHFAVRDDFTVTAALFYDRHHDLAVERTLLGGLPVYKTLVNDGSLSSYGATAQFALGGADGFTLGTNYTLSFASGTYSDPITTNSVVWLGNTFPDLTVPADFDVRHALNAVAGYRVAEEVQSTWLHGLGAGLIFQAESGRPYTALSSPSNIANPFASEVSGDINGTRRPWLHRLDVWLDKRLAVGAARVTGFLSVQNVLGVENELTVFRATDLASNDGYLGTAGGQAYTASAPVPESRAFNYTAFTGSPANVGGAQSTDALMTYGRPRQYRLGVRLAF